MQLTAVLIPAVCRSFKLMLAAARFGDTATHRSHPVKDADVGVIPWVVPDGDLVDRSNDAM